MEDRGIITAQEQKNRELLEAGLATADCYITRSYLINLSEREIVIPDEGLCQDIFLRLYHINRFVYDKEENVNDKLISVYSALHEIDGTAILIIQSDAQGVDFYLGARSERKAALCGQVMEKSLLGNFPGSSTKLLRTTETRTLLDALFTAEAGQQKNISAVSVIPSSRDEDKEKFVQGIEKFIDTMQGETYSAIFIATPINKIDLEYRKRGLESLASLLSPFVKTTLAYGENYSKAVSTGMFENFSHSLNQSISNTNGYNRGSNTSVTTGTNHGIGAGGISTGYNCDISKACTWQEEAAGFDVTVGDRHLNHNDEKDCKSIQVHVGEQNITENHTSFDGNKIVHTITVNDGNHAPWCTAAAIKDHFGEFTSAENINAQIDVEFKTDYSEKVIDKYNSERGKWYKEQEKLNNSASVRIHFPWDKE